MREILFRGQRIDNGEWVYGFYVECLDIKNEDVIPPFKKKKYIFTSWEEALLNDEDNGGVFEVISETIGQFTEILDKNDNKIFEGDKVKAFGSIYEVVYNDGAFYLRKENIHHRLSRTIQDLEIIGNIHE